MLLEYRLTGLDFNIDKPGKFILTYWKEACRRWPILAVIARDFLAIPAAGVGVERLFNIARDICGYRRHNLLPESIRSLVFLICIDNFEMTEEFRLLAHGEGLDQVEERDEVEFLDNEEEDDDEKFTDFISDGEDGLITDEEDSSNDQDIMSGHADSFRSHGRDWINGVFNSDQDDDLPGSPTKEPTLPQLPADGGRMNRLFDKFQTAARRAAVSEKGESSRNVGRDWIQPRQARINFKGKNVAR
jgi:hypothetical protein